MNKGTLPIVARLHSLQAELRVLPGGARVIAEANDRNPVAQLLRAANETMLGRSLEFASSAGPSLTLDVAGRRVLRLTASHGLPGAEACLGAEVLEDEHKDDLIKLMQAVAAPRQELRVMSGPIGRKGTMVMRASSAGLKCALTVGRIASVTSGVLGGSSASYRRMIVSEARFEVMMMIVFLKSTVRPWPSLSTPLSNT